MQKTIFNLGNIAAILSMISITFSVVAYFIWPYKGLTASINEHLALFTLILNFAAIVLVIVCRPLIFVAIDLNKRSKTSSNQTQI